MLVRLTGVGFLSKRNFACCPIPVALKIAQIAAGKTKRFAKFRFDTILRDQRFKKRASENFTARCFKAAQPENYGENQ